jgi:hypothetical protein
MSKDPAFLADAEKMGSPVDPTYDTSIYDVIGIIQQAQPGVIERLRSIIGEP